VESYQGGEVLVLFDEVGEKRLSLSFVREHGLLEPAG
jgi:hypothetical protein